MQSEGKPFPVALAIADLHLSHRPPRARSVEPNWYAAMERGIYELRQSQEHYSVPVLCAGDVFDRWQEIPELVNWALEQLPMMYAVPGQHDLPNHNYEERFRCSYETLVRAGKIIPLNPNPTFIDSNIPLMVCGFPWGTEITKPKLEEDVFKIAIAHQYAWIPSAKYPHAPKEARIRRKRNKLLNFDVVVFGDNHIGFQRRIGSTTVYNCGTFFRRTTDDIEYRPRMGLILSDGTVREIPLTIWGDKIEALESELSSAHGRLDADEFLRELEGLRERPVDYREAITRYVSDRPISLLAKRALLKAMDE